MRGAVKEEEHEHRVCIIRIATHTHTLVLLHSLTASMAGDSETHLQDREEENGHTIRQPFLIGVSGGTASGKV